MMSNAFILLVVIIGIGLFLFLKTMKKTNKLDYHSNGVPIGMEDKFAVVVNPGFDGKPVLYDLTTCKNCVKVHEFLLAHGIEHHDVAIDLFEGQARKEAVDKLRTYNPRLSFPTLVFPDGKFIIGFKESELKEAIGLND